MIIFRDDHEKYAGIRWDQQAQQFLVEGDKTYDELTSRFEEIQKSGKVELMAELDAYRESKAYRLTREFYFDITSFYGQ